MFEKTSKKLEKVNVYFVQKQVQRFNERLINQKIIFEKINYLYKTGKFIRYYFTFFITFFVILGFSGCDVCNVGESKDKDATDIFFSAVPFNGDTSAIFAVSPDGSNLRMIVNDAVLYSGPSRKKLIVFLKEDKGVDTLLYTVKTNGDSLYKSTFTISFNMVENPVTSPDGKNVAVDVGNGELIMYDFLLGAQIASNNFCEGTNLSFSPDGKYLAFYEGSNIRGPLTIKVIDTSDVNNVIYQKKFSFGIKPWKGETGIEWTSDSRTIIYILSDSGSDIINIDDIDGGNNKQIISSGIGAFMPVISPDKSTIAFAGRDGNIWLEKIIEGGNFKLTNADTAIDYNLYPQWTSDGKNVFFTHCFTDDGTDKFGGNLEIIDVQTLKKMVLSNNVFRGFIMKMMTK